MLLPGEVLMFLRAIADAFAVHNPPNCDESLFAQIILSAHSTGFGQGSEGPPGSPSGRVSGGQQIGECWSRSLKFAHSGSSSSSTSGSTRRRVFCRPGSRDSVATPKPIRKDERRGERIPPPRSPVTGFQGCFPSDRQGRSGESDAIRAESFDAAEAWACLEGGSLSHPPQHGEAFSRWGSAAEPTSAPSNPFLEHHNLPETFSADITDGNLGEEALRQQEARMRFQADALAQVNDVVYAVDHQRRVIYWNQAAEELYGYSAAEIVGRRLRDVIPLRWIRPEDEEACRRSLATTGRWRGESIRFKKSGEGLYVEASVSTIRRDETGAPGYLVVERDITARKLAEIELRRSHEELEERIRERTRELADTNQELRAEIAERLKSEAAAKESEERFRLLVEGVQDYAIYMLDPTGHILSWNVGAERIKGYAAREVLGKHFSMFYSREDVSSGEAERALAIAAREGRHEDEGWRVRQDGSRFWANALITALRDSHGKLRGFAKVTRDISERKQAQESLLELSGRLLHAQDEERRRLARELHDSTAQTLSAISLNLALLDHTAQATLTEPAIKALAACQALADQASQEIRTFSYLLHPPLLDQAGLEQALRWYVDGFGQRTKIEVALEITPPEFDRLPPDVETALFRIVQECLTNVYRHSGSPTALVSLVRGPREIRLRVEDRGTGVAVGAIGGDDGVPGDCGVGIRGMRERVRQLGGSMTFANAQPGTIAEVVLPLRQETEDRRQKL